MRPATEDVTGLPVFDIVHKIQCEAAAAVQSMHSERGYTARSKALADLSSDITRIQKELDAQQARLAESSDFGTRDEELLDAAAAIHLQIDQIYQEVVRGEALPEKTRQPLYTRLKLELDRLSLQRDKIARARRTLEDIQKRRAFVEYLKGQRKPYADVIEFEAHTVVFQFEFQITEDNNATSTGSVIWPVLWGPYGGTFTLGYDVGDKKQRYTERKVKLASVFRELVDGEKLKCADAPDDRYSRRYPIAGSIGLADVMADYITVARGGKFKSGGESYTDKIQFTTVLNGSLKPSIDISRKGGETIKASADFTGMRKDLHSVTVFLSPAEGGDDKGGGVQQVLITQMPAIRVRADVQRLPPLN